MSYNGAGTFVRIYNWGNDKNNNINITASRMDGDSNDFVSGFNTAFCRDGQATATGNFNLGGFRQTNLGNATAAADAVRADQIQKQSVTWCGNAGGTADALTLTPAPASAATTVGQRFQFKATATNATTTPTVAISGLTAITIQKNAGALAAGDVTNGRWYEVLVDSSTTCQLAQMGPTGSLPWAVAAGTADTITATYSPANGSLADGLTLSFRATAANATTAPTFSPDGLTAHTITKSGGTALLPGDIPGNLAECLFRYNLANTRWELLNPAAPPQTGVVGAARNVKMPVAAASASATLTADMIVVGTALNGLQKVLSSFSQTINLATTGAGGMDTGAAPVSGFVSLYAIAKPDGTKNILACAVATSTATIYAGANIPAGYTYSALIGIYPTNGSSQFVVGSIVDRTVSFAEVNIFTATTGQTSYGSQSISAAVPAAATAAFGNFGCVTTVNRLFSVASDAGGGGASKGMAGGAATAMDGFVGVGYWRVRLPTAQTVWWKTSEASVSEFRMGVTGFEF